MEIYWIWPTISISIIGVVLLWEGIIMKEGEWKDHEKMIKMGTLIVLSELLLESEYLGIFTSTSDFLITYNTTIGKMIMWTSTLIVLTQMFRKNYLSKLSTNEMIVLLILASTGGTVLVGGTDLLTKFIGLEWMSFATYILVSIKRTSEQSTEAGLKYYILGGIGSGLWLIGMTIIYSSTGSLELVISNEYTQIGELLIMISLLFKLGVAPFHQWILDVYEGSQSIITWYLVIVPKILTLMVLIELLSKTNYELTTILGISGILSILVGSIGGINQTKIKRLLGYSGIVGIGYMMIGLMPGTIESTAGVIINMIIYILINIGVWIIILGYYKGSRNYIVELSGLSRENKVLGITLTLLLLSLAGIPPLLGFYSKYIVLLNLIDSSLYIIALMAVMISVIGSFYYVRIVKWIYINTGESWEIKNLSKSIKMRESKMTGIGLSGSWILGWVLYLIITLIWNLGPLLKLGEEISYNINLIV